ncbi:complement C3-like [Ornithodoros turicata]|uniref:complement C3-like n=1 Tax=Ornithodoros turicata TaxID=34597 RepID=UPI003138ABC8
MASSYWNKALLCALAILTVQEVTWAKKCLVVAPNMVRLGSTETVAISVEGQQQHVELSLLEYPSKRVLFTRTEHVNSSHPKITHIMVKDTYLPESDLLPEGKAYVILRVTCTGGDGSTTNEARLLVSRSSAEYVFVQTDKPIYRPGSHVQIRFLSVDENQKPSRKELTLQTLNPQGIIVEQEVFLPLHGPIFSHQMRLPDTATTGEWTLIVRHGYKGSTSVNTTFKVEKYVLPKFSVAITDVPDYILKSFTLFSFSVEAKFVNQKPVEGFVTYRLGTKCEIGNVKWIAASAIPKWLADGVARFTITLKNLKSRYGHTNPPWDALYSGRFKLVIEATVTEEATAARETSTHDNTYFTISPFVISLQKTQKSFKPGINTYVLAEVTYVNGAPARDVELKLTANATINGTVTTRTDHRGLASFRISTSIGEKAIDVQVFTSAARFQGDQQARSTLSILPYSENTTTLIAIERSDPMRLYKAGDVYEAVVFTDPARAFQRIHYAVISKGRVHLVKKLQEGAIIQRALHFTVTDQMTPSFRIVAYATTSEGKLMSDSIYVNTEPACTRSSNFTIHRRAVQGGPVEPGSTETIAVSGTAGTAVGLLGVDKAVYLLSRKDLLTRDKLFKMLDTRDLGCGVGGGVNSRQALLQAGVVLIADGFGNSVRQDSSCHEGHHRRRREAIDLPLHLCCELGRARGVFAATCQRRVDSFRDIFDEDDSNGTACVEEFQECCYRKEESSRHEDHHRRRREAIDLPEKYKYSELGLCCALGLRTYLSERTCQRSVRVFRLFIDEDDCVEAFQECCYGREESSRHEDHHRRRREAIDLPEKYKYSELGLCCALGLRTYLSERTCQRSVRVFRLFIDEDDCVEAFQECCYGREDSSRHEGHHRRRREAIESLPEKYKDSVLRQCCEFGVRKDRFGRTCERRVDVLREFIDEDDSNGTACVEAFQECCYRREDEDGDAGARTTASGFDQLDELEMGDFGEAGVLWRSDFRETWLFTTVIIGAAGTTELSTTLPSSITTWELAAVSVSPEGGVCVAHPTEILTFKKLFLEVNLPYSVVVNEQIEIPVTLYNYGSRDVYAKVFLHGTRDICSGAKVGEKSEPQKLIVPAGRGRTAIFPVVPLDVGERLIEVSVFTNEGSDAVQKKLRIEPRGVQKNDNLVLLLDPANQQRRTARSAQNSSKGGVQYTDILSSKEDMQIVTIRKPRSTNAVPGTEKCELGIVGDRIGPALDTAINNPQGLITLPSGCGEQTMSKLAPTLYVYGYLKASHSITDAVENTVLDYIRRGYNNMLTYRKQDGSFGIFTTSPSNLWLTAFAIRNFCEARKWTMIDENIITSGLQYVLGMQQTDGKFVTEKNGLNANTWGGIQGPVPLTAYVLITLTECANDGVQMGNQMTTARAQASAFLESNLRASTDPYTLALSAYALSLANSPRKQSVLGWLKGVANYREGDNTRHISAANTPHSIEATSYAIMAFINEDEGLPYINSYINWMNQQLQPSGAFKSTQDTVVALQALTRYAMFAKEGDMDLTCEVTLSNARDFNTTVRIRRDNSHILQKVPVTGTCEHIFLNVKGYGTANAFFSYSYREEKSEDELCKFDIEIKFEEKKVHEIIGRVVRSADQEGNIKRRRDRTYSMAVCARSLGSEDIGTSIIDVGLLSGFSPVRDDLERLMDTKVIDLYELTKRSVVFYLSEIPHRQHVCIQFNLTREYVVGKIQSSTVRVYDYYNPDVACSRFYGPDSASSMLRYFCPEGSSVCQCAEGGCPSDDPMKQFVVHSGRKFFKTLEQRENMREYACDKADYVWKGRVTDIVEKDGFKNVQFIVDAVLKPGQEDKDELTGRTRVLKMRDNCNTFVEDALEERELIVMGVETGLKEETTHGKQFQYIIDSSAIVIPAVVRKGEQTYRGQTALMVWFNAEFSKSTTPCYL